MGVLSKVSAVPGGKPFEPFGKDSICSEGGSTGRRTDWPCHINIAEKVKLLRPSVQLPAGIHGCAVYTDFQRDGKAKRTNWGTALAGNPRRLDTTGSRSVFRPDFWGFPAFRGAD